VPDPAENGISVTQVRFRLNSESSLDEVRLASEHKKVEQDAPPFATFLWLQKLHNLILSVYRNIVELACTSIDPVITSLMKPEPLFDLNNNEDREAEEHNWDVYSRQIARSTKETLRGFGLLRTRRQ